MGSVFATAERTERGCTSEFRKESMCTDGCSGVGEGVVNQGGGISDPAARLAIAVRRVQVSGDAQVIRGNTCGGDGRLLPLCHIFSFLYSADRDSWNSSDHLGHTICGRNKNIFSHLYMIISVNHYFPLKF